MNNFKDSSSSLTNDSLLEELVNNKYNAVILGQAGCGKSYLIDLIRKNYNPDEVILCAPTGTAAKKISGKTIHKVFNIKKHRHVDYMSPTMGILKNAKLLIVDEVSMVSASLLSLMDWILRYTRNCEEPFGGIRVLLFGDLKQLQPVPDDDIADDQEPDIGFYHAYVVKEADFKFYNLNRNYRQEEDEYFKKILTEFRENRVSDTSINILNSNYNPTITYNPEYRYLTATNHMADVINNRILQEQEGQLYEVWRDVYYEPRTPAQEEDEEYHIGGYKDCLAKEKVPLIVHFKVGCPVMFFKNDTTEPMRYTNGTIGTVKKVFTDTMGKPEQLQVELEDGSIVLVGKETFDFDGRWLDDKTYFHLGSIKQFPCNTSFATTIDKAQGQTLHRIAIVLGRRPRPNLVYVAISRIRRLDGLVVEETPISRKQIIMSDDFDNFIDSNGLEVIQVY